MDYKEFKERVESLDIPWMVEVNHVWCPLYKMTKENGFVIQGNKDFTSLSEEYHLNEMYDFIINYNENFKSIPNIDYI